MGWRMCGEECVMGYYGDVVLRMGGRIGGEDGVVRGLDDGVVGVRVVLVSYYGVWIGEWMD